ncbi:MAG: NADH-quinone oxidoreductase subunit N [Oligoflexia bacterium]|nr:NADH-quinone oxidoreductase subunit N [Oligoflexia bacterium]MBF0364095.1 NADH-quinone oxidoreductase subunit N [Oligoflexia bacterium]
MIAITILSILAASSLITLLLTPLKRMQTLLYALSLSSLLLVLILALYQLASYESAYTLENFTFDQYSYFVCALLSAGGALIITLFFENYRSNANSEEALLAEAYPLLLLATLGMILLASTTHLIAIFVSLELTSLAVYALVALKRHSLFSGEAALKYLILGGVASATFLYGTALNFGFSGGSFSLSAAAATHAPIIAIMITTALLFKVGAAPFHSWVPDVYQGAALPITSFMAFAVKLASFVVLIRLANAMEIFSSPFSLVAIASMLTIVMGNLYALTQKELKRFLAYSSIAHSGYLLIAAASPALLPVALFYLLSYSFASIGIFTLLAPLPLSLPLKKDIDIASLQGLYFRDPLRASLLTLFLFSFAGIPLTSGFMAKFYLFFSSFQSVHISLLIVAILGAVVSIYYYLKIVITLFTPIPSAPTSTSVNTRDDSSPILLASAILCALITLLLGIYPKLALLS